MNWENITSRDNKLIRHISRLASDAKYRRANGEYVCEGEKLLWEALRDGVELHTVLWEQRSFLTAQAADPARIAALERLGCRCVTAPAQVFGAASFLETFSGPLFVCAVREYSLPETGRHFLVLDGVQDPGNVGTVIRTAAALGFDTVILCGACADVYSPKTARATMGAIFRENIVRMDITAAAEYIHSRGMKLYGAALSERAADIRAAELQNAVVAIGSEGRGLSAELLSLCDGEVIIPMTPGSESFNAAIAAAIVMWEIVR